VLGLHRSVLRSSPAAGRQCWPLPVSRCNSPHPSRHHHAVALLSRQYYASSLRPARTYRLQRPTCLSSLRNGVQAAHKCRFLVASAIRHPFLSAFLSQCYYSRQKIAPQFVCNYDVSRDRAISAVERQFSRNLGYFCKFWGGFHAYFGITILFLFFTERECAAYEI